MRRQFRIIRQRLRSLLRRDVVGREFAAAGLSEAAARRVRLVDDFVADAGYALRLMRRAPGFTLAAVLSLALGLGANTAIFSLIEAVLLRTLPVQRPQELVFLEVRGSEGGGGAPPYPCFEQLRDGASLFAGMAAFAADELRLEVDGSVEQVFGQVASGSYFDVLGLTPAAGRLLTADDERLDPAVAVIGYGYWQRRFGGSPGALGKPIVFRNRVFTIVGVTPPQFWGLQPGRQIEVTLPITHEREMLANAGAWWFEAVARLRPDAPAQQAQAQADAIFQSFMNERAPQNERRRRFFDRLALSPAAQGLDGLRSRFSAPLYALMLVGASVLLIACANLGQLLLARGAARTREFGIRLATGAGAGRLFRQLLTETLLLFVLGAAAGLLVARAAVDVLTGFFATGRNPVLIDVHFDWKLAAAAAALALGAGVLTGLWPAVRALRTDAQSAIKEGDTRLAGTRSALTAGRVLVATQVALSVVLLVAAVVFVRTIVNLRAVDLGFEPRQVLTLSLDPLIAPEAPAGTREQFWIRALERVRALPGVRAASLSVLTPLSGRDTGREVTGPGFQPRDASERTVRLNHVSEDYFLTFGVALLEGRAFTSRDSQRSDKVAVVNEAVARDYFAGRSPIGARLAFGQAGSYRIVGVVRDYKHRSVREPAPRFVFVPIWQRMDPIGRVTLSVSSARPSAVVARDVAQEVRAVHAKTLVSDVIDVGEQIDATLTSERLLATLAGSFAVLAVGLAAIGLFGIVSYAVARRRSELGLRMALGAPRSRVAAGVFLDVLLQVGIGLAIGLPLAVSAARFAEQMLFGVSAASSSSYFLSSAMLAAVACVAAWLPAWRASAIDPAEALRGH
jgi:predicted permease